MFTLVYLPVDGRGEFPRLVLEAGKIPYNKRVLQYPFDKEWADLKPTTPLGQMPILKNEETGYQVAECVAIASYAAKKSGLYPTNEEDAALSDMYALCITNKKEIFIECVIRGNRDEIKEFLDIKWPNFLDLVESRMNKNGYLVGDSLTWSDICLLDSMLIIGHEVSNVHPKIKNLMEKVKSMDGIEEYLNSDRKSITWFQRQNY
jgi:glutathione S-transferase